MCSSKGKVKKNYVAVMKYNMRAHWNRLHSTSQMPAGLLRALELAPNEKVLLGANKGFKVLASHLKGVMLV